MKDCERIRVCPEVGPDDRISELVDLLQVDLGDAEAVDVRVARDLNTELAAAKIGSAVRDRVREAGDLDQQRREAEFRCTEGLVVRKAICDNVRNRQQRQ
jgi:hypothetical protein